MSILILQEKYLHFALYLDIKPTLLYDCTFMIFVRFNDLSFTLNMHDEIQKYIDIDY